MKVSMVIFILIYACSSCLYVLVLVCMCLPCILSELLTGTFTVYACILLAFLHTRCFVSCRGRRFETATGSSLKHGAGDIVGMLGMQIAIAEHTTSVGQGLGKGQAVLTGGFGRKHLHLQRSTHQSI